MCSCGRGRCCNCFCGCRLTKPLPEHGADPDTVVSSEEYYNYLNHSQGQQARRWIYSMTWFINLYCWMQIIGNLAGFVIAHLPPILHAIDPDRYEGWATCRINQDPDNISVGCILFWHLIDLVAMVGSPIIAAWVLINVEYHHVQIDVVEQFMALLNMITLVAFAYEGLLTWQLFITDAPPAQSWTLLATSTAYFIGLLLGWYIQYHIFYFLRATNGFKLYYPQSESEIVSLVHETFVDRGKIRVVGSKHSAPPAIWTDDVTAPNQIMISLDKYTGVRIVEVDAEEAKETGVTHRAIVKGGTCLGLNRENPFSNKGNGLVYILEREGFALPDTGGVVMQTAGGFTAMGCAGGTLHHDYYDAIHSIRIVDGTGTVRTYYKPTYEQDPEYNDDYWGVIVSMGLMGVTTEITYNLTKTYKVLGSQVVWPEKKHSPHFPISWQQTGSVAEGGCQPPGQDGDYSGALDLYANNEDDSSLYQMMINPNNRYKSEYMRLFIWPQVHPALVTVWRAHRQCPDDGNLEQWKKNFPNGANGAFQDVLYHEVGDPDTGKGGVLEQKILSFMYNFFDHFMNVRNNRYPPKIQEMLQKILIQGNPTSEKGGQYFGASWAEILPMDQEMHTNLLPMQFTELWFDIEDTDKVMQFCQDYWSIQQNIGLQHTGTFSWECYPAKAGGYSDAEKGEKPGGAWLRPAYGRKSFRLDPLWFDVKTENPYQFFTPLWNGLIKKGIKFRPHWGKWFAQGNVEFPTDEYAKWSEYYADQYPKWKQWHELRAKLDPSNIFLNDYWAVALDIDKESVGGASADPGRAEEATPLLSVESN